MATKQEITGGVQEVEARLSQLLPGIEANLSQPLVSGTWTVHDALCHIAADTNAVPRFLLRLERIDRGESARPAGFNVNDYNEEQIALRKHKPVSEVVGEIKAGFESDSKAVEGLDEAMLGRQIPNARGELTEASDSLRFTLVRHNHIHLDDIEQALAALKS